MIRRSFEAILPGDGERIDSFQSLFSDYFDELFADKPEDNIPKHAMPRIIRTIMEDAQRYAMWLYLCVENGAYIGFAIFQIDTPDNPWCKREGWGFIREFYIVPSRRRNGHARAMCDFVESKLVERGVDRIYLTANETAGVPFWAAVGYTDTGEYDDKNGCAIYIKHVRKP